MDSDGNKCRLRNAKDVARVILAKAHGWDSRYTEVMNELGKKGFVPPFDKLKLEGHLLMDDFVESSVVVRKQFNKHSCVCYCLIIQYLAWKNLNFVISYITLIISCALQASTVKWIDISVNNLIVRLFSLTFH